MTRSLCLTALLLLPCAVAHADPVDSLTQVFKDTAASKTKTLTFFQGLSRLERCDIKGDDLQRAIRAGGMQADGILGAFTNGMVRIKKDKKYVYIYRSKAAMVATPSGKVQVDEEVRLRIERKGDRGVKVKKIKGAHAGKSGGHLFPLRWLELQVDDQALTHAKLNAGYGFGLNKTVEMVLKRPAKKGMASHLEQ